MAWSLLVGGPAPAPAGVADVEPAFLAAAEPAPGVVAEAPRGPPDVPGWSSLTGVGGASFRGGIRSFIASRPFASANDVILWFGEKPWSAGISKCLALVVSYMIN